MSEQPKTYVLQSGPAPVLKFGKFQGQTLDQVPKFYLRWLKKQPWIKYHPEIARALGVFDKLKKIVNPKSEIRNPSTLPAEVEPSGKPQAVSAGSETGPLQAISDAKAGNAHRDNHGPARLCSKTITNRLQREQRVKQYDDLIAGGYSSQDACKAIGVSMTTMWRYKQPDGTNPKTDRGGRKPDYMPSPDELACVREIYAKLDESVARGRGLGSSKITAYRLAAKSEDPRIGLIFRAIVLDPKRKHKAVPKSWERLLDTPAAALDAARDKRSTMATHISTPRGRYWIDAAGRSQPMRAGHIFEADDGTFNFYCWIPWPFGGDKCSDKFGVKLGRWQILQVVDAHSLMIVAWDIVARNLSSYRGEDAGCLLGRTMIEEAMPSLWRLERGSWESKFVRDLLGMVHVPCVNAWHSKQKAAVENAFDRLWTPLSLIPGHVGRDRGRYKHIDDLAAACMDGRRDPRDYFVSLEQSIPKVAGAVKFVNTEPVESVWGKWVPQERYETHTQEVQPHKLDAEHRVLFSREQRVKTVRKSCIGFNVEGPLVKFPIYFQPPELVMFNGCKVKAYFDPWADEVTATITLQDESWRDYKRNDIIAKDVPALKLPPQFVLDKLTAGTDEQLARQLAIRKQMSKAVRTESMTWRGLHTSRASDGLHVAVREAGQTVPTVRTLPSVRTEIKKLDAETLQARRNRLAEDAELVRQQRQSANQL